MEVVVVEVDLEEGEEEVGAEADLGEVEAVGVDVEDLEVVVEEEVVEALGVEVVKNVSMITLCFVHIFIKTFHITTITSGSLFVVHVTLTNDDHE